MFIKWIISTLIIILISLFILKADVDSSFYDIKITMKGLRIKRLQQKR